MHLHALCHLQLKLLSACLLTCMYLNSYIVLAEEHNVRITGRFYKLIARSLLNNTAKISIHETFLLD